MGEFPVICENGRLLSGYMVITSGGTGNPAQIELSLSGSRSYDLGEGLHQKVLKLMVEVFGMDEKSIDKYLDKSKTHHGKTSHCTLTLKIPNRANGPPLLEIFLERLEKVIGLKRINPNEIKGG